MMLVFPRFRQCLFSLTNMADRESSSQNNTRSRSVQDVVCTVLHAVTNLQTQSGNPNRAENSSSAEFSSAEEEINARFQIPRHRRVNSAVFLCPSALSSSLPKDVKNPSMLGNQIRAPCIMLFKRVWFT